MIQFRDLKRQYERLKKDIDLAIEDVIIGTSFISGKQVKELEKQLADYVGVKHCISCANGTDALTLALMTWNIGDNDAVFVPDFTFFSSGECPAFLGAMPIFVDVDRHTYNMDPSCLELTIEKVLKEGRYTPKAVVAVDMFGLPADYNAIRSVCEKYNLFLLEDGAQGFGGRYQKRRACSFGDISTTSFFPAKPLGCYGDGGAIFTNDDNWAELLRSFCVHGKSGSDKYINARIGMNSRLDTLQAAILIPKLRAFCEYELDSVNRIADLYNDQLSDLDLVLPVADEGYLSSWAQYTIQLPGGTNRDKVQSLMKQQDIPTMVYYKKPMHKQAAFADSRAAEADCPVTGELCDTVLSLPMHPYLTESDIHRIISALKGALAI